MSRVPFHRINALRDEILRWAVAHHEDELLEGARLYMAQPKTEEELRAALAFSILSPPPGREALVVRFARQAGHRPRVERDWLKTWESTRFGVMVVLDVDPGFWVEVHDVLGGRRMKIAERMGSLQMEPGDWFIAFYYKGPSGWLFEGSMQRMSKLASDKAVNTALAELSDLTPGLESQAALPGQTHQFARPTLRAIHRASLAPRLVNADHHDILQVTLTLKVSWRKVVRTLRSWPDSRVEETWVDLFGEVPVEMMGGPVARATFRIDEGVVTLYANSRQRIDDVLHRWKAKTGRALPVVNEAVEAVDSCPDGEVFVLDSQPVPLPEGADPDEVGRSHLAAWQAKWPDTPVPTLDGLTPRQAAAVPRLEPMLWALCHKQDNEALFERLGLTLPPLE